MRRGIALLMIGAAFCSPAGLSEETHSHPPPEKLGTVTFATSCLPRVSHDFERAVALLHSFAYAASEKAFSDVASADPSCAMAHWGIAMSYYHQLWSPPGPEDLIRGRSQVAEAKSLGVKTKRERQFIAAAAAYYDDYEHSPPPARAKRYEEAMRAAATTNPNDTEVMVFYALSMIATAPPEDKTHANQKRASLILEPIYRKFPDHPGVAHYLIHDYDSAELAARGLAPARAYSKIAPSAPHALHMPSHIFTRLGLWDDSVASNIAARAAARSQGDVGEELHAMDYLVYAYLQQGRSAEAEQVVAALSSMDGLGGNDFKVGYAATVMPIRLAMERSNWNVASGMKPLPDSAPHIAAMVFWARAVANSRAGQPQAAGEDIARLEKCREQLTAAGNSYWATQVEILGEEAQAWQLAASSRVDEALRLMRQAADQEDAIEKLPLTPGPIVPAREQLGELLLSANKPADALQEFRTALAAAPGRRGALSGAAKAADLAGDAKTAREMRSALS